jgi:hypothetical protein
VSFSLIASVSKCTPDINTSPKRMYTRARSKERFDFARHYGLGNSVRGVARAIALAALRTDLFVRRYALKNALGRVSNAREPVHPPPSSESDCTRASWAEIRISRRPVAPTIRYDRFARSLRQLVNSLCLRPPFSYSCYHLRRSVSTADCTTGVRIKWYKSRFPADSSVRLE